MARSTVFNYKGKIVDPQEIGRKLKHYQRALEINPNFAPAHLYYGVYLANRGRLSAGIEEMKQAERLDPLTPLTSTLVAHWYYVARQYDEAISKSQKIIEIKPDFYLAHSILGLLYEQQGMLAEAVAEFNEARRIDPEQPFTLGYLGHAYAISGKRDEARKMLAEMEHRSKRMYVAPLSVAIIYAGLGEKDEAFAFLEKAYQERDENLLHYRDAPILDSLRSDPRFTDLLRRLKLTP